MARKRKDKFRAVATRETGIEATPRQVVHVSDAGKVRLYTVDALGGFAGEPAEVAELARLDWTEVPAGPCEPASTDKVRKAIVGNA